MNFVLPMNCYVVLHKAVKDCCFYEGFVGGVLYTQVKLRILGGLEFWISYLSITTHGG